MTEGNKAYPWACCVCSDGRYIIWVGDKRKVDRVPRVRQLRNSFPRFTITSTFQFPMRQLKDSNVVKELK